jgi:hypothetical protein
MIMHSLCGTLAIRRDHDTMLYHIIFLVVLFIPFVFFPTSRISRTLTPPGNIIWDW